VDLPLQEGLEACIPVLLNLCNKKKELMGMLISEKIKLAGYGIVYLPFKKTGSEYVQKEFGFSIQKNSLKFGRKL